MPPPGRPHATRNQLRHSDMRHPSSALHGLRSINGNFKADGTGRDWIVFGDPGYSGGRATPPPKHRHMPTFGGRPADFGEPVRAPRVNGAGVGPMRDGRKAAAAGGSAGSTGKPTAATLERWKMSTGMETFTRPGRVAPRLDESRSAPTLPPMGLEQERAMDPEEGSKLLDLKFKTSTRNLGSQDHFALSAQASANLLDARFKPNSALLPGQNPLTIDKYHYFSEIAPIKVREMVARGPPGPESRLPGATAYKEFSENCSLQEPWTQTHQFFSETHVKSSPHFACQSAEDGLAGPRRHQPPFAPTRG